MKTFYCIFRMAPLTAIALAGQALLASDLPIVNPSFESPPTTSWTQGWAGDNTAMPGWTISGAGNAGEGYEPSFSSLISAPPDGSQIGYINPIGLTSVSQTLTSDLQANMSYSLQLDVTGRSDGMNPGTEYSVGLYAGNTLLSAVTPVTPAFGTWDVLSASFTSGSSVPAGDALSVVISTWGTGQLDFDNVIVDPVPAPDGGTTAMLLGLSVAGLGWFRRRN